MKRKNLQYLNSGMKNLKNKNKRLDLIQDPTCENYFTCSCQKKVFARINRVNTVWIVWLYPLHYQKNFAKVKDALVYVNSKFMEYIQ